MAPEGWYYADGSGALTAGWRLVNGSWYWLDPSTNVMDTGPTDIAGHTYYLHSSGAMATCWVGGGSCERWFSGSGALVATVENDTVTWADASRPAAQGMVQVGDRCYYMDPQTGTIYHGKLDLDGTEYLFDEQTGILHTGWCRNASDQWLYLEQNGNHRNGWSYIGSNWYWFDSNGIMKTGWLNLGGTWYYLNDDGSMVTGWKSVGGTWYLPSGSGNMLTGWQNLGGTWYYLQASAPWPPAGSGTAPGASSTAAAPG